MVSLLQVISGMRNTTCTVELAHSLRSKKTLRGRRDESETHRSRAITLRVTGHQTNKHKTGQYLIYVY